MSEQITTAETNFIEHIKTGWDGKLCLVCEQEPYRSWTDYNGQVYCHHCGCTYQILGSHLREEFLAKHGLKPADVAESYCDCFESIPLLRLHWAETKLPAPIGMWLGGAPYSREVYTAWRLWVMTNAERLRVVAPDEYDWDKIIADRDGASKEPPCPPTH